MTNVDVKLDNRLYAFQHNKLPADLSSMVTSADIAYLKDDNNLANTILDDVEKECEERGFAILSVDRFWLLKPKS